MSQLPVNRREFLQVGLTALGGLVVGIRVDSVPTPESARALAPNAFVRVEPNGDVVVIVPRPEMGQGSRTAIAMLVAEELEADWERVRVEQADLDEERYGPQYAGGSAVVRTSWTPLRRAGAAARTLLVSAAASRWNVDASQCVAESGRVRHATTGRIASYQSLATVAAALSAPTEVALK